MSILKLQNLVANKWVDTGQVRRELLDPATQEPIAFLQDGLPDFSEMLYYARNIGRSNIQSLTFHKRALLLKKLGIFLLEHKEKYYELSTRSGATRTDSWIDIDGGIGTLFTYSGKGRRELPNSFHVIDGDPEILSKDATFIGQHVYSPLEGSAVHINAFNFPCWGMLEKFAPCFLAGMPSIIKPASQTCYITEAIVRDIVSSNILPVGSLQLVCGDVGALLKQLNYQDVVTFTGSQATGSIIKTNACLIDNNVRFHMETDSLNSIILGHDVTSDSLEFRIFVREVVTEMTVKAGQKCTAIRRVIVPESIKDIVVEKLKERLAQVKIGDPRLLETKMGPLASISHREDVTREAEKLAASCETVIGAIESHSNAFTEPVVFLSQLPITECPSNLIEVFGPMCTIQTYQNDDEAIDIARAGKGSLVGSIVSNDRNVTTKLIDGLFAHHGRLLVLNRHCQKTSTGHGSPLPVLLHGGPGRAGGAEELGGLRSIYAYMQRTAIQGHPDMLTSICQKWLPGATKNLTHKHPFQMHFDELSIGDSLRTKSRKISLDDIEHFAHFTGDRFYAHMDEALARANPFFEGRVAHGYFIISAAAGLFVDPEPGPVLANYGLESLRFTQPVYPNDEITVSLTCKQKTAREGERYGEVRWDTTVLNQDNLVVAQYDVLTLVEQSSH